MTARCLDAAAWTVALAGADGDDVAACLPPAWRARLVGAVAALRPSGSRDQRARVLAAAGLRLLSPQRDGAELDDGSGPRFVAAWLRSLDPPDRAAFVRALSADSLAALQQALPSAPRLDRAQRSTATHLVDLAHRGLGRPPTLPEWSSLLQALALLGTPVDASLLRVTRIARLSPRADECLALAAEICSR